METSWSEEERIGMQKAHRNEREVMQDKILQEVLGDQGPYFLHRVHRHSPAAVVTKDKGTA